MDNVVLSRAIMGTSLGFHIVFAVLAIAAGMVVLAPSLWLLFRVFKGHDPAAD